MSDEPPGGAGRPRASHRDVTSHAVATKHPRIGVTLDPELAVALETTRSLLGPKAVRSEAGHVRRLALIGARVVREGTSEARGAADRQRLLDRPGVRPATRDFSDLPWLDEPVDEHREPLTDALDWVRGSR